MEFLDTKAIYLQIAEFICDKILLEEYREEDKVLSIRDLAVLVEVNPNTVQRSYEYLQQNNIIFTERGKGYFVSKNAKSVIGKLRKEAFLANELPHFFKNLHLLDIDLKTIETHYKTFLKEFKG